MTKHTIFDIDLIVQSFAYAARQLARANGASPSAQYAEILAAAEKYRSALRLAQRDMRESATLALRRQNLTPAEAEWVRDSAVKTIERAHEGISRILAQYAPQKLAA